MRVFAGPLAIALWLASLGTTTAQTPSVFTSSIKRLLDERGHAYREAREALLTRQDVVEMARATRETTAYGRSTWLKLVLTEALAMHVTHREEAGILHNLRGLESDHYLRRRVPVPSAARELRRLRHVAPLMIELFIKGMETYAWSSPATAEVEAKTLRRDLLLAIGQSDHPASVHFLTDVVQGGCVCCETCNFAIAALGDTGALQALPVLLGVLDEARGGGDVAAHTAVVAALGRIRHAAVWPHLAAELRAPDRRVRKVAVRSAAAYGSRRYWRTDPAQGGRIRGAIGLSLLDVLAEAEDEALVTAVLESLSSVATPQLRDVIEGSQAAPPYSARSTDSHTVASDRFRQALERVNRTLTRQ